VLADHLTLHSACGDKPTLACDGFGLTGSPPIVFTGVKLKIP